MAQKRKKTSKHGKAETRSKKRFSFNLSRKQKQIAAVVAVFVLVFCATYGRKIYKLKEENRALKQQQEELKEEQSRLTKELKNINSKDYIKEQAREKLRLLDKDEILFIFRENGDD